MSAYRSQQLYIEPFVTCLLCARRGPSTDTPLFYSVSCLMAPSPSVIQSVDAEVFQ